MGCSTYLKEKALANILIYRHYCMVNQYPLPSPPLPSPPPHPEILIGISCCDEILTLVSLHRQFAANLQKTTTNNKWILRRAEKNSQSNDTLCYKEFLTGFGFTSCKPAEIFVTKTSRNGNSP